MSFRFLIFVTITLTASLGAGLKKQVETYAPYVLGPLVVPTIAGILYSPFTRGKREELARLNRLHNRTENERVKAFTLAKKLSETQTPKLNRQYELAWEIIKTGRDICKNTNKIVWDIYEFRHTVFGEEKKEWKALRPMETGKLITTLDELVASINRWEKVGSEGYKEEVEQRKKTQYQDVFEERWKELLGQTKKLEEELGRYQEELEKKIKKINRAWFWSLRRFFVQPYTFRYSPSWWNIILYALTAYSAVDWGPATIRAIIQKIKHR